MIGLTWNHVPVLSFSFGYFQVFLSFLNSFVIGGVGKNGSTVAVRILYVFYKKKILLNK